MAYPHPQNRVGRAGARVVSKLCKNAKGMVLHKFCEEFSKFLTCLRLPNGYLMDQL